MKIFVKALLLTFSALLVMCLTVEAQAPGTFVYQGRLTDISGEPITTAQTVTFAIYSVPTSGLVRWSETLTIVPDAEGVFTVELGQLDTTLFTVFNGSKRYLGIRVGDDDEMSPRQLLTSTPYAISAQNIPDLTVSTDKLADTAVTHEKIADDAVTSLNIADNSVVAADLRDEPGLTSHFSLPANAARAIPAGTNELDTIKISVPAAGYVYVWANANVFVNHTAGTLDQLVFQVSDNPDSIIPNNFGLAMVKVPAELPTSENYAYPINCHRAFAVSGSGDYMYFFTAKVYSGAGSPDTFFNLQLTAMYFPTGYGTVSTSPPQGVSNGTGSGKKTEEGRD